MSSFVHGTKPAAGSSAHAVAPLCCPVGVDHHRAPLLPSHPVGIDHRRAPLLPHRGEVTPGTSSGGGGQSRQPPAAAAAGGVSPATSNGSGRRSRTDLEQQQWWGAVGQDSGGIGGSRIGGAGIFRSPAAVQKEESILSILGGSGQKKTSFVSAPCFL
jgi:hypothetical protein